MALIDDLKNEGYDVSQITPELISSLEGEGYDVSGLSQPSQPTEPTNDYRDVLKNMAGEAAVKSTLGPLGELGMAYINNIPKLFDKMGEVTAEQLSSGLTPKTGSTIPGPLNISLEPTPGKGVRLPPEAAAAAGFAVSEIPTMVEGLVPGGAAVAGKRAVESAAKAGMRKVADSSIGQALRETGKKEVMALSERAAELPIKQAAKREAVMAAKEAAGKGIGAAEKVAKIGIDDVKVGEFAARVGKNPATMAKFASQMERAGAKGAETLAKEASPKWLQTMRKTAENLLKKGNLDNETRVVLSRNKKVFTDALRKSDSGVNEAMTKYDDVIKVVNELPDQFKREKQLLNLALTKARNKAAKQAGTRGAIKEGAKAVGIGALGLGAASKILGK